MQDFETWSDEYMVCTDFVGAYLRENEHAVAVYGEVGGDEHTWVYDPELDKTLDATLSQFAGFVSGCEEDGWFHGDEHPIADEMERFDSLEAFAEGPGGNYLLEA